MLKHRALALASLVSLIGLGAAAASPPTSSLPSRVRPLAEGEVDVAAMGNQLPNGEIQLTVSLGRFFTHGAKVYSEPSHTLLLAGFPKELEKRAEMIRVAEEIRKSPGSALITGPFPDVQASVVVRGRPATDNAIVITALLANAEVVVAEAFVGSGSFSFSGRYHDNEGLLDPDPTWCCESSLCAKVCVDCSGHAFTCCKDPGNGCCYSQAYIFCGFVSCELCPP